MNQAGRWGGGKSVPGRRNSTSKGLTELQGNYRSQGLAEGRGDNGQAGSEGEKYYTQVVFPKYLLRPDLGQNWSWLP